MRLLFKILEFTHTDPKAIFWISWVLSALVLLPRILEKFRWHPPGGVTDPWQFGVLILLILLAIVAGWPLWRILQKEKHAAIRESIVVVIGFVPIQILFLVLFGGIAEVIKSTSHLGAERPLFMTGLVISSFVGGCWIGFTKTGKTWLWCALGALFFWGPFIIERITWGTKRINWGTSRNSEVLIWIALAVMGGYFGRWVSLRGNEKEPHTSVV